MKKILNEILSILEPCGRIIEKIQLGGGVQTSRKIDQSLVTNVDLSLQEHLINGLLRAFPKIPIISEEMSGPNHQDRKGWDKFFLIDPLDGTKEFVAGRKEYTINVSLVLDGIPTIGAIYAPAFNSIYSGVLGEGAWIGEVGGQTKPLTPKNSLGKESTILLSHDEPQGEMLNSLIAKYNLPNIVRMGSSLKFCKLAEGHAHYYYRGIPCREWDVAAADCIYSSSWGVVPGERILPFEYNKPTLEISPFLIYNGKAMHV